MICERAPKQLGILLSVLVVFFVAPAEKALASWWGPPSCDEAAVTDDILAELKKFQEDSIRSSGAGGGLGTALLKALHYRHITRSYVEIISIAEIESDSDSRSCLLKTRWYFDRAEAKAVLSEIRDTKELQQIFATLQGYPLLEKFLSLYKDGFYNEIYYKVFLNSESSVDFVVTQLR